MAKFYSVIIATITILFAIFILSFIRPITKIVGSKAKCNNNRFWLSILLGIAHLALMILSEILKKPNLIISCIMTGWFVAAILFKETSKNRWD